jgi:NhaP-type Na+/H+ or K+/H+ antiporter
LVVWFVGCLVGWLFGCLVGCLVGLAIRKMFADLVHIASARRLWTLSQVTGPD